MVSVHLNSKTGILESKFEGDVFLKDILDYIIATKENKSYPRVLKILTDSSKAIFNFTPSDLPFIVEENFKSLEKYDYIIDAIVLSKPNETALSALYNEFAKTKKYKFKLFSTTEAAIKWLKNN